MSGQLKTYQDAKARKIQHKSPCSDCPFARKSVRGWIGGMSVDEWLVAVHGEGMFDCHTVSNQQCAGAAIFRANVCKSPRREDVLRLPSDTVRVFSSSQEFRWHHEGSVWKDR
jgi:hypothetical protein